jgi:cardiolipin synthase
VPEAESRIFTIPNVISLVRLLCVPIFVWLLWKNPPAPIAAGALLAVLGATDWVDGYIARHFNQGSNLGKILDPTADRVLLVAGAVTLLFEDLGFGVDVVLVIILIREVLIAGATIALGLAGARRIDVVWAGKAGTLALMFALPLFIWADNSSGVVHGLVALAAWGFAIGGIILGYYAAARYIPAAREALKEGRATHHVGSEVGT